jgi:hypothetical protein
MDLDKCKGIFVGRDKLPEIDVVIWSVADK